MRKVSTVLFVFLTLCLGVTVLAKPKRYEVSLDKTVQAGNTQINAGTYQMETDDGSITFYKGKKEVAKVPVRSEEAANKAEGTSVSVRDNKLLWIQPDGSKTKLVVEGN